MDGFLEKFSKIKKDNVNTLFIITKSNNSNILNYQMEKQDFIKPIWWMYEKKGTPNEDLTFLERTMVYGVVKNNSTNNEVLFHLVGYPKIELRLSNIEGSYSVLYKNNILLGLHVYLSTNILQNVIGIDIFYLENNKLKKEYIKNY